MSLSTSQSCDRVEFGGLAGGDDAEEETTFWREYLLFNQTEGFAFLVDTDEGWSIVRPLTGAPWHEIARRGLHQRSSASMSTRALPWCGAWRTSTSRGGWRSSAMACS